jgi:PIN domain nuclease of toxin-antitoxin system
MPCSGWFYGDRRLSKTARAIMNSTEPLFHSAASFWEIALKRAGKGFDFEIEDQWDRVLTAELHRIGVRRLDIEAADCRAVEDLPPHHRDPFDRDAGCPGHAPKPGAPLPGHPARRLRPCRARGNSPACGARSQGRGIRDTQIRGVIRNS